VQDTFKDHREPLKLIGAARGKNQGYTAS